MGNHTSGFSSVVSVSFQKNQKRDSKRIQNGHSIWLSLHFKSVTSNVKPRDPEPIMQIVRTSILGQISAFLNLLAGTFVCWCISSQERTFSKLIFVRTMGSETVFLPCKSPITIGSQIILPMNLNIILQN